MRPPFATILIVAVTLLAPPRTYAIEPVSSCGQFIRGSGILVGDLDCSVADEDAVKLQGRLHLAGFSITGHPAHAVVRCLKGACRVEGPGAISGGAEGVRSDKNTRLIDLTIRNNGTGVRALKTARLDRAQILDNGETGVDADKINAHSSSFLNNGGDGAHTVRKATLLGCTVTGNAGDGVSSDRLAKVSHSSIVTGNGLDGVDAGRIMLKKTSAVFLNGTSAACGVTEECDDLATARRPVISLDSSCGSSRNTADGGDWGACPGD